VTKNQAGSLVCSVCYMKRCVNCHKVLWLTDEVKFPGDGLMACIQDCTHSHTPVIPVKYKIPTKECPHATW
jgi:hypothetical protein